MAQEALETEYLFMDAEERDKPPLDWHHPESFQNREGRGQFLKYLMFFLMVLLFSSRGWVRSGLGDFGPALPFALPPHTELAAFGLLVTVLVVFAILGRRRTGKSVSRIRVHDGHFDMVSKDNGALMHIPVEQVGAVEIRDPLFEMDGCRMTVVDLGGRRYTLKPLADTSRLDPFAAYCGQARIAYARRRNSLAGMALFCSAFFVPAIIMLAAREHEHPVPAVLSFLFMVAAYAVMSWLLNKMLK